MSSILDRLVEPTDPEERRAAIRICRVNNFRDPETGEPEPDREKTHRLFRELEPVIPAEKWLWMWNFGLDEWEGPGAQARRDAMFKRLGLQDAAAGPAGGERSERDGTR